MCPRVRRGKIGACRRWSVSAGNGLQERNVMTRPLVAELAAERLSRRTAVGQLAGAGAATAIAVTSLGRSRGAAQGPSSTVRSSIERLSS